MAFLSALFSCFIPSSSSRISDATMHNLKLSVSAPSLEKPKGKAKWGGAPIP
ncbi:unnamed protein product, partial [Ilex paraguariensis]